MKPMRAVLTASLFAFALASGTAQAEGDPAAGEKVYKNCKSCHATEAGDHRVGPSLAGVIGRQAGGAEGYKYSDAMTGSGITWDTASLGQYLEAPKKFMPGTKMTFAGLKAQADRDNVIAYLQSLSN